MNICIVLHCLIKISVVVVVFCFFLLLLFLFLFCVSFDLVSGP